MVDKPINFNSALAELKSDCRFLNVKDLLEETLGEVDNHNWQKCLIILYDRIDEEAETFKIDTRVSGCTTLEMRGLFLSWLREHFGEES